MLSSMQESGMVHGLKDFLLNAPLDSMRVEVVTKGLSYAISSLFVLEFCSVQQLGAVATSNIV